MARKNKHKSGSNPGRPRFWGRHAVAAALDNPERRVLKAWATREAAGFMQFPSDVAVVMAEAADLARLVPADAPHQGVVIEVEPLEDIWLSDLLADAPEKALLLVLDQVTDPHNVGAILRSAAAFGAVGVVLQDRHAPRFTGALAKAAAGAVDKVPVARVVNLSRALDELTDAGWRAVGLTGDADQSLGEALTGGPTVLVLGSEGEGMRRLVAEHCDELAKIPMPGGFESLNVSAAAAVAIYEASRPRS